MSDEQKKQPTTVQMPAVPDWAIELTKSVKTGFAQVDARLDTIESNVDLQGVTVRDVAQRMTALEGRQNNLEDRAANNSMRVKESSAVDLKHDAAIAEIRTTVAQLAAKPDATDKIIDAVKDGAKTPTGQKLIGGVVSVLLLVLALLGAKLQSQLSHIEQQNTEQRGAK